MAVLTLLPYFFVMYMLLLKLRRKVAQLPPVELSNFLCHNVLVRGVSAMAPMIFFIFEAVSCMISAEEGWEVWQCQNTNTAAVFLSVYVCITIGISLASRTVPQQEKGEGMTYSNLAILRLKVKEMVQGALGVITALASMYLFSFLGVEGEYNATILWMGSAGLETLLIAAIVEGASIAFGRLGSAGGSQAGSSSASLGETSNFSAVVEEQLSLEDVEENMTFAGLV